MNTIARVTDPLPQPIRIAWLHDHADDMRSLIIAKFEAGEKEHKEDIGSLSIGGLLMEMTHEAIDQLNYVAELRRRFDNSGLVVVDRKDLGLLYRELNNIAPQSRHFSGALENAMGRIEQLLEQSK